MIIHCFNIYYLKGVIHPKTIYLYEKIELCGNLQFLTKRLKQSSMVVHLKNES
jgi:hypothetical protein